MEATCSSETSVDFQQTTKHYIPEDRTLQYVSYSCKYNTISNRWTLLSRMTCSSTCMPSLPTIFLLIHISTDQISNFTVLFMFMDLHLYVLYHKHHYHYVGFEVFTVVVMKSTIFWDVTQCSLLRCSSETSVASQQTTRRHIPEDDTLHHYHCLQKLSTIRFWALWIYNKIFSCFFKDTRLFQEQWSCFSRTLTKFVCDTVYSDMLLHNSPYIFN
jgi:hypothetical protein